MAADRTDPDCQDVRDGQDRQPAAGDATRRYVYSNLPRSASLIRSQWMLLPVAIF